MIAVPVLSADRRFAAGIAELAPRARPTSDPRGAVHVVPGRAGWWDEVLSVIAQGASGVVVAEPVSAPATAHLRLRGLDVPVGVARRLLRPDRIEDAAASEPPPLVVVDASAPRPMMTELVRDAAGWARVLVGGALETRVVAPASGSPAVMIALTGPGGAPVTLTVTGSGAGTSPALTAAALGVHRVEVRLDDAAGVGEVVHISATGRHVPTPRRESAERLALRRVIEAIADGSLLSDVVDLAHDDRVAESVSRSITDVDAGHPRNRLP